MSFLCLQGSRALLLCSSLGQRGSKQSQASVSSLLHLLSFQLNALMALGRKGARVFYTGGHRSPVWGERILFDLEEGTKNFKLEVSSRFIPLKTSREAEPRHLNLIFGSRSTMTQSGNPRS